VIQTQLILASRSPRRAQLLREAGYDFVQAEPAFADPPQPEEGVADPATFAVELAVRKAESLREILPDHVPPSAGQTIIISADTVCVGTDGSLIGQPVDAADAKRMIRSFVGVTHDVVTGVCLVRMRHPFVSPTAADVMTFADVVPVTFGVLADRELDAYLASNQWKGKAGGYNLFDRQATGWPITTPVDSDPTTVVGLPMIKIAGALAAWGMRPLEPGIA